MIEPYLPFIRQADPGETPEAHGQPSVCDGAQAGLHGRSGPLQAHGEPLPCTPAGRSLPASAHVAWRIIVSLRLLAGGALESVELFRIDVALGSHEAFYALVAGRGAMLVDEAW